MFIAYLIIIFVMSLITYSFYRIDKKRAQRNYNPRIKERTLLLLSVFFGAFGGLIAMYTLRHKTKHWYFVVVNVISFILQGVVLALIINKVGVTGFSDFFGNLQI